MESINKPMTFAFLGYKGESFHHNACCNFYDMYFT